MTADTFPLGSLPLELRLLLYQHILETTSPRIFELRILSDPDTGLPVAGPHVVPHKGLRPPPILHAIPEARRHLLPQFVLSFRGSTPDDQRKSSKGVDGCEEGAPGWLFHPAVDILFFSGKDMNDLMKSNGPFQRVQNVAFHPSTWNVVFFRVWASTLAEHFPDMRALTLCLMGPPLICAADRWMVEEQQLVMDAQRPRAVHVGAPSLSGESGAEMTFEGLMSRELGAACGRTIDVECRTIRRCKSHVESTSKPLSKVLFKAI